MIKIDVSKPLNGASGAMELQVSLAIQRGDFVAITGKSGSGKTTLLRIVAGLEESKGKVEVDGVLWQDKNRFLPPQKRKIGFVFQEYALFSNMSVLQNLLYVNKDRALANKLLEMTDLTSLQHSYPNSLSGGQQQRVSLCRAMMKQPKILLLDEPFSALDIAMRRKLQNEIATIHKDFRITTIMVSHDPSEIYKLANRTLVLDNGKIAADGSPKEVLLNSSGSQEFAMSGEVIDIKKADILYIAVVAVAGQIIEVTIDKKTAKELQVGDRVEVSTKAFALTLSKQG